ncbi:MAG TPA: hypothetical protein DDZ51_23805 [Planctomycetaceae bacterium]|nr:hypothetical protein [Planctomycetaceae bacterium]
MMSESFANCVPLVACCIAVFHDLRTREIPDWLPILMILLFTLRWILGGASLPWWHHIGGGLVALAIGLVVGYGDRFGGGDIKLFATIGLWFGLFAVVPLALWIAIAGLPLAVIAAARKQNDFAYAPAILVGVCVHVWAPNLLQQLAS